MVSLSLVHLKPLMLSNLHFTPMQTTSASLEAPMQSQPSLGSLGLAYVCQGCTIGAVLHITIAYHVLESLVTDEVIVKAEGMYSVLSDALAILLSKWHRYKCYSFIQCDSKQIIRLNIRLLEHENLYATYFSFL